MSHHGKRVWILRPVLLLPGLLCGCSRAVEPPSSAMKDASLSVQSANAAVQGLMHPAHTPIQGRESIEPGHSPASGDAKRR